jgi:hypothetical protein
MIKKIMGGAALVAGLLFLQPVQQASAVTLLSPGMAATTKQVSDNLVTEVRWGGRRGFHRGHFRGHRGWGGHRGWRVHRWHHRRHWAPRPYFAAPRRCRIVMTYYGPQRVCRRWWY